MTTKHKNNVVKETTTVATKAPKPTIKSLQTEIEYLKKELTSANNNYIALNADYKVISDEYDTLLTNNFSTKTKAASWNTFDSMGFFGKLFYVLFGGNCLRDKE